VFAYTRRTWTGRSPRQQHVVHRGYRGFLPGDTLDSRRLISGFVVCEF